MSKMAPKWVAASRADGCALKAFTSKPYRHSTCLGKPSELGHLTIAQGQHDIKAGRQGGVRTSMLKLPTAPSCFREAGAASTAPEALMTRWT